MKSILTVYRKELADYFSSKKFIVLLALVYIVGLVFTYVAVQDITSASSTTDQTLFIRVFIDEFIFLRLFTVGELFGAFNFVKFLGIFIALIGILFGFDAISGEKTSGNLSRLLSQPIYRDSLINGKFLAGIVTISIMICSIVLIISGIGLRTIGIVPSSEEILRIMIFVIICIIYGTFWMGLSMLFSVVMKNTVTSILVAIPIWLFFVFFWWMISQAIANSVAPADVSALQNQAIFTNLQRISPEYLFNESVLVLLNPTISHISLTPSSMGSALNYYIPNPLSLGQSLIQIWPQLIIIIALAVICFAIAYIVFMKQEIRAT